MKSPPIKGHQPAPGPDPGTIRPGDPARWIRPAGSGPLAGARGDVIVYGGFEASLFMDTATQPRPCIPGPIDIYQWYR